MMMRMPRWSKGHAVGSIDGRQDHVLDGYDQRKILLTIPCVSGYVSVVRLAVAGLASRMNFPVDAIDDIKIAISEACTNAIQHAYTDGQLGVIAITLINQDDTLEIEIKDTGKGFDPNALDSVNGGQLTHDDPRGLGMGLTFIKSLMDDMVVDTSSGYGTTVTMKKRLTGVAGC